MAGLGLAGEGREHTNRLDCWCVPRVWLYCQYCEGMEGTTEAPGQCFMCKGAHVFPMVASDRKRLQELVDDGHDRPPLIVVHMSGSADGLALELHTHIILGQVDGAEDDDDDDDEGDDDDEPGAPWETNPDGWKNRGHNR